MRGVPKEESRLKSSLIGSTILYLILLVPAGILAPFIVQIFDISVIGGWWLWLFMISWMLLPVVLGASIVGSWWAFGKKRIELTRYLILMPAINIAVLLVAAAVLFS